MKSGVWKRAPLQPNRKPVYEEFTVAMIKLLQWNIRSLLNNFANLKIFIRDYGPDVIALNKTFLKPEHRLTITNHTLLRSGRQDGYEDIAFTIKNGIPFSSISLLNLAMPDHLQVAGLQIGDHYKYVYSPELSNSRRTHYRISAVHPGTLPTSRRLKCSELKVGVWYKKPQ
ncbi:hypothetical protein HHI36_014816 [Cryptolaemus montrouzieri]|uniref:Uncharacterized protein n=1 Tax=Cryptolaemus montrouzieri TaxID=559131 RepID=A0ABD2N431_9CUCU